MSESFVWQYFNRKPDEESAVCIKCSSKLKCKGWSTSGLLRHLKSKHNIDKPAKRPAESDNARVNSPGSSNKKCCVQPKIDVFIKRTTLEEIITILAVIDNISINTITKSKFIRESLFEKGFTLPKNPSHVMELVNKQYVKIKDEICSEINKEIKADARFSLSLDEYTSLNNRRYLNINVHKDVKFWNLGMIKINGSLPADIAHETVQLKLEEFNLSIEKHIVACVTDGARVMVKFGKLIECEHQLCYAHGIHLAVCDVLYKKTDSLVISYEEVQDNEQLENCDDDFFTDTIQMEDQLPDTCDVTLDETEISEITTINVSISSVICKIRKLCRLFRKSPVKNEILQQYVIKDSGKQLNLILDSKTRWNSLLAMIERFLNVRHSVSKALIDCKEVESDINDEEATVMTQLVNALQPVKAGAEQLGSRDSTLLSAEGIFNFILTELQQQNTPISLKLKDKLIIRINERRNKNLVGLMSYLQKGKKYNKSYVPDLNQLPPKSTLVSQGKKIMKKLYNLEENSASEDEEPLQESSLSLSEKLKNALMSAESEIPEQKQSREQYLTKEFEIFEATCERTQNLTVLLNCLKTIPPTSIESERAFSAAGRFVTKFRTRLSDKNFNILCFLRAYYQQDEKT